MLKGLKRIFGVEEAASCANALYRASRESLPLMSKPVRLNDAELSHIFEAARPIPVDSRDAFLEQVATLLRGCSDAGPGDVHRAIEQAQRQFFIPPQRARLRDGTGTGPTSRGSASRRRQVRTF